MADPGQAGRGMVDVIAELQQAAASGRFPSAVEAGADFLAWLDRHLWWGAPRPAGDATAEALAEALVRLADGDFGPLRALMDFPGAAQELRDWRRWRRA
jgi:hypothetical protein